MPPSRDDLWTPERIARLEEPRIAHSVGAIATASRPWLGGVMARGAPGSWVNQALGVGLDVAEPTAGDIAELREFYEPHGIEPRVEVTPFVSPALLAVLGDTGFRLRGFETVLACDLAAWSPSAEPPAGVAVRPLDRTDADEVERFGRALHRVFMHDEPTDGDLRLLQAMVAVDFAHGFVATVDGAFAGGGMVDVCGEVATLYFGATIDRFRRRGVQTALLLARLRLAREHGVRIATVGSEPSRTTERNAMRCGLTPAYTRQALVRPGEGLTPSP
jgi:GNAT superfamily N-acetyltransferase